MTEVKQPKPFLKKGTRQYLSNATVRSLNQKPKIVDFGEGQEQFETRPTITNPVRKESQEIKVEIKVSNKPKPKKEIQVKNTLPLAKENKHFNQDKINSDYASQNKKKTTALDDYIVTKNNKNDNNTKERPLPPKVSLINQQKISMVGALKRQDQHLSDDDQDDNQSIVQEKKTFKPPTVTISGNKHHAPSSVSNAKKVINIDLEQHAQKINFNSDSEQQAPSKSKPFKPQVFPKPVEKKNRWDDDQSQEKVVPEEPKGPSKILQKFYKKQPEVQASKPHIGQKKLTTADIPMQLKLQIFQELLAEKQSGLTKKLEELQSSIEKANKEREALKEAGKQLAKERTQFEQEMQRRKKEFQEKVNAQNNKLSREKKYLKEHQTSGKVDWRVKNEVQQLKGKFEQSEAERKKMKAAHLQEMQRIKKKLQEYEAQNQMLKGQIRCIEMQKLQLKQKAKQAQKKNNIIQPSNDTSKYWHDAPTRSYVSNFFQDNFTLISFDPNHYDFQNLQYYRYYCQKKDEVSELVSEQIDQNGDKITRRYKNGKEEIQYVGKVIKEIFPTPFKFTVVHHQNGDVKMVLPQGIIVYYDRKNQITEWKVNPDKVIYNFHKLSQIQMKFRHRRFGEIQECYKNKQLKRTQQGEVVTYNRNEKGDIIPVSRGY